VGVLSPFLSAWLPTILGLVVGLYLLLRASK
jgi:lipopolysaccharide export system permease protein